MIPTPSPVTLKMTRGGGRRSNSSAEIPGNTPILPPVASQQNNGIQQECRWPDQGIRTIIKNVSRSPLIHAIRKERCRAPTPARPDLIKDQTDSPGKSKSPTYPSRQPGLVAKTDLSRRGHHENWHSLISPSRKLIFLDNRTPEHQEHSNRLHLLPLLPQSDEEGRHHSLLKQEFWRQEIFKDEHISPHISALFINGKKAQESPIQNFNPQEIGPLLEIFDMIGCSR